MAKTPEDFMLLGDCEAVHIERGKKSKGHDVSKSNDDSPQRLSHAEVRPLLPQLLVVGGSYIIALSCGVSQGHSSVLLPKLTASNTSLHTDTNMASWIVSAHVAANPLGSLLGGLLTDQYGRRKIVIFGTLPYILGWVLIASAQNHTMLLVGRFLDGIAKGIVTASRMVHLDELADPKYRGLLASSVSISFVSGILLIYLLGGFLDWRLASWLAALCPLSGLLAFLWLPESPVWLVRKRREREAADVLKWIWGPGKEDKAMLELRDMVSRFSCRQSPNLSSGKNMPSTCGVHWWKTFLAPHNLKPFFIMHIFNLFQIICGTQLIIVLAKSIIPDSKNSETSHPFLSMILTAVVRLAFIILFCFLVPRVNRRPLVISSGIGSTISTLVLGTILYIQVTRSDPLFTPEAGRYVVIGLVLVYVGASTCGFFSLPFIMSGEVIPSMFRGTMCGYIFAANDLALFGAVQYFPWLLETIGHHGLFWLFGGSCLACTIFVYLFLPETQGRSLVVIEDYFRQRNTFWIRRSKNEYY